MQSDRTIQAGSKTYAIRYGQNGMYLLECHLAKLRTEGVLKVRTFIQKNEQTGVSIEVEAPVNVFDIWQLPRIVAVQALVWAALESARRYYRSRSEPFTLDEAANIIDDAGGFQNLEADAVAAFKASFPQIYIDAITPSAAEPPEKNAPEETVPEQPTGIANSSKRKKSA